MPTTHDLTQLSLIKITTTREVILYAQHTVTGRAMASPAEGIPYAPCGGVRLESGSPALIDFDDDGTAVHFTGGIVLLVEQLPGPPLEPMP
ncbi:hypothetical protein [Cryobacterium sp. MDB2-33-2]|uniref:hypothetical protein n=1 Tax=Cryobacterium sp. MDB2-33-2 TaxID=1259179 RepID=UPI00106C3092|nr:hypothetical protein [Cryobacterium sp. MDB2-33-2]TFC06540.1 hypothetical protein E3O59_10215 [Cryobacterium sp. MDB2-33-2]